MADCLFCKIVEKEIPAKIVHEDADVVVVDDGSSDRTSDAARGKGVAVLTLPLNLGVGGAMRTGYLYAKRNGYERAVQVDADGQHAHILAVGYDQRPEEIIPF